LFFSFPHGNIFITYTCLGSIAEVETAVIALFAFENFNNKVVIVTGASEGIGRALW
jgi:hypothetical protein